MYTQEDLQYIIERFNKFIFDELSSAIGYFKIAEQLTGFGAAKVIEELKEHGKEEFGHYTELLHYAYLHGFGDKLNIQCLDENVINYIPKDLNSCVAFIQSLEIHARDDYRDMIKFARDHQDIEMEEFFRELMADEQEHYDDLAYILDNKIKLGESKGETMGLFKEILEKVIKEEKWIDKVKPKWHPPKGTFAEDTPADKAAEIVCKASDNLKQAVERVNFFFNRCGKKCEPWGEKKRKEIIDILHKICKNK